MPTTADRKFCLEVLGIWILFELLPQLFWRRKWQPTPVFLPGESHGQRSLVGYSPWGSPSDSHILSPLMCCLCTYTFDTRGPCAQSPHYTWGLLFFPQPRPCLALLLTYSWCSVSNCRRIPWTEKPFLK